MSDPSYLLAMRNELILHFPPLHELVISRPWLLCYGKYRPSKIKLHVQNTKDEIYLFISWQIWPFMYALNKFPVNISTSDLTIQYYFIASIIMFWCFIYAYSHWLGSAKACAPSYFHFCYFGLVDQNWK